MIVLALGQKGSGKSRTLRTLAARRLLSSQTSCVLVHDPYDQWARGARFEASSALRAHVAGRGTMPRLSRIVADDVGAVAALALELGHVTLVIDELDLGCSGKRWRYEPLRQVAHYGRHRGVDLFGSFRSTRNLHEDLPALADFVFVLRHSPAAVYDLRTIGERFGEEYAEAARTMPDHFAAVWPPAS